LFSDDEILHEIEELVRKISSSSSDDSSVPPRPSMGEFLPFINKKVSIAMSFVGGSTARYHADELSCKLTIAFGQNYVKNGKKALSVFMGDIYIMRRALHRWALFHAEKTHLFVAAGTPKAVMRNYTRRHVGDKA
jgi:hypothetical protein